MNTHMANVPVWAWGLLVLFAIVLLSWSRSNGRRVDEKIRRHIREDMERDAELNRLRRRDEE